MELNGLLQHQDGLPDTRCRAQELGTARVSFLRNLPLDEAVKSHHLAASRRMITGLSATMIDWDPLTAELDKRQTVLLVDHRG